MASPLPPFPEETTMGGSGPPCCCGDAAGGASKPAGGGIDARFRSYLCATNLDLVAITVVLACYHAHTALASEEGDHNAAEGGHGEQTEEQILAEEHRETYAVLFPWFSEIIGVFVYYFLSRYLHAIPYTAIMFLVGAAIGYSIQRVDVNAVTFSASTWITIEGEVILLVFLPGLLYLDSYNIDVHLFLSSFSQLLTFAFPMVLAGTSLTALVACYVFPYNWSFDLSMTFGAILAATDPVAVSVLLNELGAPPRLKMHISGESLLNDGSAVVFYHIFALRFLAEMGIDGVGENIDWAEGFRLFFRLALGGMCIGIAFGIGLIIVLHNLNRRLSGEDAVVQVVATITTAYLSFFTSEILAGCSGIIAVVFCGVSVKAFGETLYNDSHLSRHFWEITEYLLNTLLFTLAGCVWGNMLSFDQFNGMGAEGSDWGYLFLLYVLITAIRFFLMFAFYPVTSRIGIGTTWREAVFMSYGGLRGAVGIALALSLHAEVYHITSAEDVSDELRTEYREYTATLFGMVGGIALLTLIINGPTAGPLLKKLGLITPTETREKVVENYRQHMISFVLKEYVELLTEPRFHDVDLNVVRDHIPFFSDVTYETFMSAVRKHKKSTPESAYVKPHLKNVIPYLYEQEERRGGRPVELGREYIAEESDDDKPKDPPSPRPLRRAQLLKSRRQSVRSIRRTTGNREAVFNRETIFDLRARYDKKAVQEERLVFIKIVRSAYFKQIDHGELESRGFIIHSLLQSLNYAEDAASRGLPLSDWNAVEVASDSLARPAETVLRRLFRFKKNARRGKFSIGSDLDFFLVQMKVLQCLSFIHAHQRARQVFKEEFSKAGNENILTPAEKIVLDECDEQIELSDEVLSNLPEADVCIVKSHYVCQILLNRAAYYFTKLKKHGLMSEKEAGEFCEQIEEWLFHTAECREVVHSDQMSTERKNDRLSMIPDIDDLLALDSRTKQARGGGEEKFASSGPQRHLSDTEERDLKELEAARGQRDQA